MSTEDISDSLNSTEPPQGTRQWADYIIGYYDKDKLAGPGKDLSTALELPHIEACAVISIEDPSWFDRRKDVLKGRGLNAGRISDLTQRVRTREHEIRAERKREQKTQAQQQAKLQKAAGAQPKSATWTELKTTLQQPVDGNVLFRNLVHAIRKFVHISEDQAIVLALWLLFTWLFEKCAETNPFLHIIAADKNCGKSTLLKVLRRLARAGWLIASSTRSAFIRRAQQSRFTLLVDEADSFLQQNEEFRNVLDAANDPDTAVIALSEKVNDQWVPIDINVYLPFGFASIKRLRGMDTVEDRSIPIYLDRATQAERKLLIKASIRNLDRELKSFVDRCARWAMDHADHVAKLDPPLDFDDGRDEDKWRPLIAIADYLDAGTLGPKVREIGKRIAGDTEEDRVTLGVRLLNDIKKLFDQRREQMPEDLADKYPSEAMCKDLHGIPDRPWAAMPTRRGDSKPLDQRRLASMLKNYRTPEGMTIKPRKLRIGDATPNGYLRQNFEDAWKRYTVPAEDTAADNQETEPPQPASDPSASDEFTENPIFMRNSGTTLRGEGQSALFAPGTEESCSGSQNSTNPLGEKGCAGVPDKNRDPGDDARTMGISTPICHENAASVPTDYWANGKTKNH